MISNSSSWEFKKKSPRFRNFGLNLLLKAAWNEKVLKCSYKIERIFFTWLKSSWISPVLVGISRWVKIVHVKYEIFFTAWSTTDDASQINFTKISPVNIFRVIFFKSIRNSRFTPSFGTEIPDFSKNGVLFIVFSTFEEICPNILAIVFWLPWDRPWKSRETEKQWLKAIHSNVYNILCFVLCALSKCVYVLIKCSHSMALSSSSASSPSSSSILRERGGESKFDAFIKSPIFSDHLSFTWNGCTCVCVCQFLLYPHSRAQHLYVWTTSTTFERNGRHSIDTLSFNRYTAEHSYTFLCAIDVCSFLEILQKPAPNNSFQKLTSTKPTDIRMHLPSIVQISDGHFAF